MIFIFHKRSLAGMREHLTVDLKNFVNPLRQKDEARFEAFNDGYGAMVVHKQIVAENVRIEEVEGGIRVTATHNGRNEKNEVVLADAKRVTFLEGTCTGLDLPHNWRGYDKVELTITNGSKPLTIEGIIVGTRGRIIDRRDLDPKQTVTLVMDAGDVPLIQGKHPPYEPNALRIAVLWDGPHEERDFTINTIAMLPRHSEDVRPCVDRFGQRITARWPEKISSEEELKAAIDVENAELEKMSPPSDRSRFGGWTGGPRWEARGFFGVHRDENGRWWYVDPEGYPFWSVGTTGVRYSDNTNPKDREELFEELPPREGPFAEVWDESGCVQFYLWNLLRKWGNPEAWRDHVLKRLKKWGYNTIANWSAPLMLDQQEIAHVRTLNTKGPPEVMCSKSFYDVFDPRWEHWFSRECARLAAPYKDNPWIIGYFVDNEKKWMRMKLLDASADCAVRDQWVNLVKERYDSVDSFNTAAGLSLESWDAVATMRDEDLPYEGVSQDLRRELEDRYTERYFSEVRRILKAADPNHLYLGCRFVKMHPRDEIIRTAGKYVDVMSVNSYSLVPDRGRFQHWYDLSQKPIQIGEHQLAMYGTRQHPPTWPAFTENERREWYPKYDLTFASMPFSVGSHWFQWADQCITGRPSNGENQMIGLVDITDQPHPEMVEAVRDIASKVYDRHASSK
ncbi:MAG: hypothetical protein GF344_17310 [Chitinivibrionales bacterium]|nr:hypothetical protein [Chitinivibrionales bacterium]MBD3358429.1 hypothetical protein [Chitinivibrionales bacterium]